jgi:hypothetical protein
MAFFDLRLPLGWLFVIIGGLVTAAGFYVSPVSSDGHPLGSNVNLVWGVVLLVFGIINLLAARNYARKRAEQSELKT